jgi:hypothetical protein
MNATGGADEQTMTPGKVAAPGVPTAWPFLFATAGLVGEAMGNGKQHTTEM